MKKLCILAGQRNWAYTCAVIEVKKRKSQAVPMKLHPRLPHCFLLAILLPAAAAFGAGPSEKILHAFSGSDGSTPEAGMVFDSSGTLYGTTALGGDPNACYSGNCGTIFQLSPQAGGSWSEVVLYSFNLNDGAYPDEDMVLDTAGNLYGVTDVGGGTQGGAFELIKSGSGWQYAVINAFNGGRDGGSPRSDLLIDSQGNLFGTTAAGGKAGAGTVYELISGSSGTWSESIVFSFGVPGSGFEPQAGLIQDARGNFYGTTGFGGNPACPQGCGVVFELSPSVHGRWVKRVLHKFDGTDGKMPIADLVADAAGNLFGVATEGGNAGCYGGCGTIFELVRGGSGWKFRLLYSFQSETGGSPLGHLVFDHKGNLYGSTNAGGIIPPCQQQAGCGVVFKFSPNKGRAWAYTVLHKFTNGQDGALPNGVVLDKAGNIYGTTITGGAYDSGTVFEVTP
jgi:uncharacterized repeat protein (TIGR03803 family)